MLHFYVAQRVYHFSSREMRINVNLVTPSLLGTHDKAVDGLNFL